MEENKKSVRPIFKFLLIVAIALFVIGSCIIQADLYYKVGRLEHTMSHILGK